MRTDDLISQLAGDLPPTPAGAAERRVAAAMAAGAVLAFGVMLMWLGFRADLAEAVHTPMFWLKLVYPLALAGVGVLLVGRLGRPEGRVGGLRWAVLVPVAPVVLLGLVQLLTAPDEARLAIWLGGSAAHCPWRILALAVPTFVGLLWAFRRMAPTRPALAGLAAGLTAGGVGAAVYALACGETAPAFLATWYSLGVALAAAGGALAGSRLLRW